MVLETPTATRRERVRAATRAEVLETAWEIVRAEGLAALSLSELARRAGMRPPSMYTYFESKNAIYDAMFAQGAQAHLDLLRSVAPPRELRAALEAAVRAFFDFCRADPARYQLLFQRTIPGFEPSPCSFAIAEEALRFVAAELAERGVDRPEDVDLLTALVTGLVDQQLSNDPDGDRWERLIGTAVGMFLNHVNSPRHRPARTNTRRTP